MRVRVIRLAAVAVLAVTGLIASTVSVSAAPSPTPNGWVGACNMSSSWPGFSPGNAFGVTKHGGMEHAMTVNNPNGNLGMFRAVFVSGNQAC